jgi:hypothetical protein
MDNLMVPVARLDALCDAFTGLAQAAAEHGWPHEAALAASMVARQLEQFAGELDGAGDQHQARIILDQARRALPAALLAFGKAFAETLQSGVRLRRVRREAGS